MSWGWCWVHWGVKFRLFKKFLTRGQGSDSLTDFRKIFLDMGTFIYPRTPDLIPCRWENSFLTFLKTAVVTNMSSNEFPSDENVSVFQVFQAWMETVFSYLSNQHRQRQLWCVCIMSGCYSLDYACLLKPKISILHQKPVSPFFEFSLLWLLPLSPNVDTMFTITRDKGTTVWNTSKD